jgi:hypothetical protein
MRCSNIWSPLLTATVNGQLDDFSSSTNHDLETGLPVLVPLSTQSITIGGIESLSHVQRRYGIPDESCVSPLRS